MKIANPNRTIGAVMAEQGKRPNGWYEIDTLCGIAQGVYPDVLQVDVMDDAGLERLTAEVRDMEHHPWRYNVDKVGAMVRVRAIRQENRVTETQPARLGGRAWEADPERYFGDGLVPGTMILAGSEHDPRLGSEPRWENE